MVDNEEHLGLVYRVAQELANSNETCIRVFGRDVKSYLGEGFIALDIAKNGYKAELGWQFSTYASVVIRNRIIQAARRALPMVNVSFQARCEAAKMLAGKEIDPKHEKKAKAALT
jgi:DNA-directed RNA polymerase specialized sigma subunit